MGSYVESDVDLFVREGVTWISAGGGGGGEADFEVLEPADVPARAATGFEIETIARDTDGYRSAVSGVAGAEAHSVEVEQAGVVVQRPIEAPLGRFVVSTEGALFTVRVRDENGFVLGEELIDVAQNFIG